MPAFEIMIYGPENRKPVRRMAERASFPLEWTSFMDWSGVPRHQLTARGASRWDRRVADTSRLLPGLLVL